MINRLIFFFFLFISIAGQTSAQPLQGQAAAEIALPSATGDTLRLSAFKGKIVLLDFWASWCGPCRYANKGLTRIYDKYNDKGFEIYSVSLDNEKQDWMTAIKKDRIKWKQVIEPGGWETPTALKWGIFELPTTFLIDRDGTLLAMDLEGKDLEKALKELLKK